MDYDSLPMNFNKFFVLSSFLLLVACSGNAAKGAADYALAVQYMRGDGVPKDEQKAMTYLTRAAAEGNANAELGMGYHYLQGSAGLTKDSEKAAVFFTRAAKHGNRDAQYNIGLAYVRGEGVTKDLAKAYTWFEKAAYQDDAGAQYNLGVMSVNGEGTAKDPLTAYVWFRIADEKAYGGAKEGMDAAKVDMTADQANDIDRTYEKISRKVKKLRDSAGSANQAL